MQISNELEIQSFRFTTDKPNMLVRAEEIDNLAEIDAYCKNIQESFHWIDDIWYMEVEKGVMLVDWLFSSKGEGSDDDRRQLQELLSKNTQITDENAKPITISLGTYDDLVSDLKMYINARRDILKGISNPIEFESFMKSCFANSLFADNILSEMKNIVDFSEHTEEIVNNLSVLNDEAIDLYKKYHNNLKIAMDILASKLLACSPDPNHVQSLKFTFSYLENIKGENVAKYKEIACSPHLKLIHRGSDLRIYFYWCDKDVGNGEKVLVGRIGSHPY